MEINLNEIKYRKATAADIETLIDYRSIFLKEAYPFPGEEVERVLRSSLKEYLLKSFEADTFLAWLAEYEGSPVGFSGLVMREQPGNFDLPNGKTGYILNMFTLPEFRNMGIGSNLFRKLIDEARARKLDRIDLHATRAGEPVYRKFGFTEPHDTVLELILRS